MSGRAEGVRFTVHECFVLSNGLVLTRSGGAYEVEPHCGDVMLDYLIPLNREMAEQEGGSLCLHTDQGQWVVPVASVVGVRVEVRDRDGSPIRLKSGYATTVPHEVELVDDDGQVCRIEVDGPDVKVRFDGAAGWRTVYSAALDPGVDGGDDVDRQVAAMEHAEQLIEEKVRSGWKLRRTND